ncbi:MAG: alkaline phosphatase D family protein [Candidatus Limnocylindria bacterium]
MAVFVDPIGPLRVRLTRRALLAAVASSAAAYLVACTSRVLPRPTPAPARANRTLAPSRPDILEPIPDSLIFGDAPVKIRWTAVPGARDYAVELNGTVVDTTPTNEVEFGFDSNSVGLQEGLNALRIVARAGDEVWSDATHFELAPVRGVRARHFDLEDDGPVEATAGSAGAVLEIGAAFAFGSSGKGVRLKVEAGSDGVAYENLRSIPLGDSWVRLRVRFLDCCEQSRRISLARIRASGSSATERLIWTGSTVSTSSLRDTLVVPADEWLQLQFGVTANGDVELWVFDGAHERLVGRGTNADLAAETKDIVSFGNDISDPGGPVEVWLDNIAIAEARLPWLKSEPDPVPTRLPKLDPAALPGVFSFAFGSCNVSTWVPYRGFALNAAADMEPDFVVHLGDNCYPDTGAYRQTTAGYLALWSDLLYEEQLGRLARRPWLYVASDHDLGGNNIDRDSVLSAASEAFDRWQSNPRTQHPEGRYGLIDLDHGRIRLIWVDAISYRSPLSDPDGPDKTMLGSEQKAWLLDTLARQEGRLVIIASQTTIGHASDTGWAAYSRERREILQACRSSGATVRWITGDHHTARWTRMGNSMAEWGAAPFAEVPQGDMELPDDVDEGLMAVGARDLVGSSVKLERAQILAALTIDQLRSVSSFGRVEIDTLRGTARFEVRDHQGEIRVHSSGFRFTETLQYR